jgi:hypothetical protein
MTDTNPINDPRYSAPSPDADWRRHFEFRPWFTEPAPVFQLDPLLISVKPEWQIDPVLHKWSSPLKKK